MFNAGYWYQYGQNFCVGRSGDKGAWFPGKNTGGWGLVKVTLQELG